jgi:replicative DNA helicase
VNNLSNVPQNVEAELGVLGSMMVEESIVSDLVPMLHKSYFLSSAHQLIFEAIAYLFDNSRPVDPVAVVEELKRRGVLEQSGGESYLLSLMESIPSAGNYAYYAKIVRAKGMMRQLIKAAETIIDDVKSGTTELDALLDKAERLVFEVTQKEISSEPCHLNNLLLQIVSDLEKDKKLFDGVLTGFRDLDDLITGLPNSSLIIIAGRPSMGKTSFALNIAAHVSANQNVGALIFSLEMPKDQVAQNLLCSWLSINPRKIRNGLLPPEEYLRITQEVARLGMAPLFIDDSASPSLREIRAKMRRLKVKYNIGLIIIDYIQLLENADERRSENRQQEVSQISRGLKTMAREFNVPVIALSQLNRSVDARDDHRPRMSDLRESGALEQDADLILFLYRDEYYNKESTTNKNMAEVIVGKHRNGPTGDVKLAFIKEHMRFLCLDEHFRIYGSLPSN